MLLPVQVTVYEPMYEYNEKKYLRIRLPDKVRDYIRELHEHKTGLILFPKQLDDPLEGNVLKIKVPFRYRRVMCNVDGDTPVQSLKKGDLPKYSLMVFGTHTITVGTRGY
jgi:hypothetical protein